MTDTSSISQFTKPKKIKESNYEKVLRYRRNAIKKSLLAPKKVVKKAKRVKLPKIKREPLKTIKRKADEIFSLWIRNRDGNTCVTPDNTCKGCIQASHLLKRSYYDIRWDEKNVFAQCQHHNYNHDQGFRPSPQILTSYFLKKHGQIEYEDLVHRSKKVYTGREIRELAMIIIEKYK